MHSRDLTHAVLLRDSTSRATSYVTKQELKQTNGWPSSRVDRVIGSMLKVGMAWVDDQTGGDRQFWFPSVWSSRGMADVDTAAAGDA